MFRAEAAVTCRDVEQFRGNVRTSFAFNHASGFDNVKGLSRAADQQCFSVNDPTDERSLWQINPTCGDRFERIWRSLNRYSAAPACKYCHEGRTDNEEVQVLWVPEILATYFRKFWPLRHPDLSRLLASRQA